MAEIKTTCLVAEIAFDDWQRRRPASPRSTLNPSWDPWQSNYFLFLTPVWKEKKEKREHTQNCQHKVGGRVCYTSLWRIQPLSLWTFQTSSLLLLTLHSPHPDHCKEPGRLLFSAAGEGNGLKSLSEPICVPAVRVGIVCLMKLPSQQKRKLTHIHTKNPKFQKWHYVKGLQSFSAYLRNALD